MPWIWPRISPRTMPSMRTRPEDWCCETGVGTSKEVLSMTFSPRSRICGRMNMTMMIVMMVPRPRLSPIPAMAALEVIWPMRMPAMTIMRPEVMIVGKARFMVSMMASFLGILSLNSMKRLVVTMA